MIGIEKASRQRWMAVVGLLLGVAAATLGATPARADDGPTLNKMSVHIRVWREGNYWPNPNAKEPQYNTWSWRPRIDFYMKGPLVGGSQLLVDVTKPTGGPWLTFLCQTPEIGAEEYARIETPREAPGINEKKNIILTGTFGVKIRLKNELAGTNDTLFAGKFKVSKFHKGNALPQFKNRFEYVVDHDWTLPIGQLWFDWGLDDRLPPLRAAMWVKGDSSTSNLAGYLFYKGKQIASSKDQTGSLSYDETITTAGVDRGDPVWTHWVFGWNLVRQQGEQSTNGASPEAFFIDKNPGDYEVKVLRNGQLARVAKFTVGEDGKIVDSGIVAANKLGSLRMILPVKILGTQDGAWQQGAWKTDGLYGNVLSGFTAPD